MLKALFAPAGWLGNSWTATIWSNWKYSGDEKTLFPDVLETLKAAEILIRDGFKVMVYTNDDPMSGQTF